MNETSGGSISFFGLVAMGIGCMLGTGWLLLTGTWLETAGGPVSLAAAFLLSIVIELPLAFAYMEAIPMLPLPGGEAVYSCAAFGPLGGFFVGWAGILMNAIVFCWVNLAAISLLTELIPALNAAGLLYRVNGYAVTLPKILLQMGMAGGIVAIQLRGADVCASLAKIATITLLTMCLAGLAVGFAHFEPAVYAMDGGLEFHFSGAASLVSLLVFSVAGWEIVAKAAADARGRAVRKAGAALLTCLVVVSALLCLVPTVVAGNMPWTQAVGRTAPFADVLVEITGLSLVRPALLITAFVGAVGVMNSTLYGASQMLYGLSKFRLAPDFFARAHPRHGTPSRAVWFAAAFMLLTPFTGKLLFLPLINIASLASIIMWVMTFGAVLKLRKSHPELPRPVRMPGGRLTMVLGIPASAFLVGNILLPMSPGALDPLEYGVTLALAGVGGVLYALRDRTVTEQERETLMFGDLLRKNGA